MVDIGVCLYAKVVRSLPSTIAMIESALIRTALPGDAPGIAQLMSGLGFDHSVEEIVRRWSLVSDQNVDPVLVATRGSLLIGVLALHISPLLFYPQPLARITTLAVSEDYRRQGIGRLLVEEAIRLAREARCDTIELTTGLHRKDAHAFYERLGFLHKAIKLERRLVDP